MDCSGVGAGMCTGPAPVRCDPRGAGTLARRKTAGRSKDTFVHRRIGPFTSAPLVRKEQVVPPGRRSALTRPCSAAGSRPAYATLLCCWFKARLRDLAPLLVQGPLRDLELR